MINLYARDVLVHAWPVAVMTAVRVRLYGKICGN